MYYLRSRYYNSDIIRFINADELICDKNSLLVPNIFAYCLNSPTAALDSDGHNTKNVFFAFVETIATCVIEAIKTIVSAVGAEMQLVVNRSSAKRALKKIGKKQTNYLVNYPYGGADLAIYEGLFGKYKWFYNQVNHNAPIDYKVKDRRPWWTFNKRNFYFRGKKITLEEYGNINYGYVGKALGIPDWILYAGGGYAAITGHGDTGSIGTFFDSQEDHENIAWGIMIYNETWGDN